MELSRTIETETGEMIVKRVSVPLGLEEIMESFAKEVILKKPKDIYLFASEYFTRILHLRDSGLYRGNVRTAKMAVKHPSKSAMKQNIFSTSNENSTRKPSTPYYLRQTSDVTAKFDGNRRAKIQEQLRKKREVYESELRDSRKKSGSKKGLSTEFEEKNRSPGERQSRKSEKENIDAPIQAKNIMYRKTSKSVEIEEGKKISPRKRSSSISSSKSRTTSKEGTKFSVHEGLGICGTNNLTQKVMRINEASENIEANSQIINECSNMSSTQNESGRYEISHSPTLVQGITTEKSVSNETQENVMDKVALDSATNEEENSPEKQEKSELLDLFSTNVSSIIKIQSLWRGIQARKKVKLSSENDNGNHGVQKLSGNAETRLEDSETKSEIENGETFGKDLIELEKKGDSTASIENDKQEINEDVNKSEKSLEKEKTINESSTCSSLKTEHLIENQSTTKINESTSVMLNTSSTKTVNSIKEMHDGSGKNVIEGDPLEHTANNELIEGKSDGKTEAEAHEILESVSDSKEISNSSPLTSSGIDGVSEEQKAENKKASTLECSEKSFNAEISARKSDLPDKSELKKENSLEIVSARESKTPKSEDQIDSITFDRKDSSGQLSDRREYSDDKETSCTTPVSTNPEELCTETKDSSEAAKSGRNNTENGTSAISENSENSDKLNMIETGNSVPLIEPKELENQRKSSIPIDAPPERIEVTRKSSIESIPNSIESNSMNKISITDNISSNILDASTSKRDTEEAITENAVHSIEPLNTKDLIDESGEKTNGNSCEDLHGEEANELPNLETTVVEEKFSQKKRETDDHEQPSTEARNSEGTDANSVEGSKKPIEEVERVNHSNSLSTDNREKRLVSSEDIIEQEIGTENLLNEEQETQPYVNESTILTDENPRDEVEGTNHTISSNEKEKTLRPSEGTTGETIRTDDSVREIPNEEVAPHLIERNQMSNVQGSTDCLSNEESLAASKEKPGECQTEKIVGEGIDNPDHISEHIEENLRKSELIVDNEEEKLASSSIETAMKENKGKTNEKIEETEEKVVMDNEVSITKIEETNREKIKSNIQEQPLEESVAIGENNDAVKREEMIGKNNIEVNNADSNTKEKGENSSSVSKETFPSEVVLDGVDKPDRILENAVGGGSSNEEKTRLQNGEQHSENHIDADAEKIVFLNTEDSSSVVSAEKSSLINIEDGGNSEDAEKTNNGSLGEADNGQKLLHGEDVSTDKSDGNNNSDTNQLVDSISTKNNLHTNEEDNCEGKFQNHDSFEHTNELPDSIPKKNNSVEKIEDTEGKPHEKAVAHHDSFEDTNKLPDSIPKQNNSVEKIEETEEKPYEKIVVHHDSFDHTNKLSDSVPKKNNSVEKIEETEEKPHEKIVVHHDSFDHTNKLPDSVPKKNNSVEKIEEAQEKPHEKIVVHHDSFEHTNELPDLITKQNNSFEKMEKTEEKPQEKTVVLMLTSEASEPDSLKSFLPEKINSQIKEDEENRGIENDSPLEISEKSETKNKSENSNDLMENLSLESNYLKDASKIINKTSEVFKNTENSDSTCETIGNNSVAYTETEQLKSNEDKDGTNESHNENKPPEAIEKKTLEETENEMKDLENDGSKETDVSRTENISYFATSNSSVPRAGNSEESEIGQGNELRNGESEIQDEDPKFLTSPRAGEDEDGPPKKEELVYHRSITILASDGENSKNPDNDNELAKKENRIEGEEFQGKGRDQEVKKEEITSSKDSLNKTELLSEESKDNVNPSEETVTPRTKKQRDFVNFKNQINSVSNEHVVSKEEKTVSMVGEVEKQSKDNPHGEAKISKGLVETIPTARQTKERKGNISARKLQKQNSVENKNHLVNGIAKNTSDSVDRQLKLKKTRSQSHKIKPVIDEKKNRSNIRRTYSEDSGLGSSRKKDRKSISPEKRTSRTRNLKLDNENELIINSKKMDLKESSGFKEIDDDGESKELVANMNGGDVEDENLVGKTEESSGAEYMKRNIHEDQKTKDHSEEENNESILYVTEKSSESSKQEQVSDKFGGNTPKTSVDDSKNKEKEDNLRSINENSEKEGSENPESLLGNEEFKMKKTKEIDDPILSKESDLESNISKTTGEEKEPEENSFQKENLAQLQNNSTLNHHDAQDGHQYTSAGLENNTQDGGNNYITSEIKSAIRIQSIWRGFQARRKFLNILKQKTLSTEKPDDSTKSINDNTDENENLISETKKLNETTLLKNKEGFIEAPNREKREISGSSANGNNSMTLNGVVTSSNKLKARKSKDISLSNLDLSSDIGRQYVNQALKIQSAWRAYKVRKNIRDVEEKINEIEHQAGHELPKSIHLSDSEILKAVTKIQAGLRGYIARKHVKTLRERYKSLDGIREESNSEDEKIMESLKKLDDVTVPDTTPELSSNEEENGERHGTIQDVSGEKEISQNHGTNVSNIQEHHGKSSNSGTDIKKSESSSRETTGVVESSEVSDNSGKETCFVENTPQEESNSGDRSPNENKGKLRKSKAADNLVKLAEQYENSDAQRSQKVGLEESSVERSEENCKKDEVSNENPETKLAVFELPGIESEGNVNAGPGIFEKKIDEQIEGISINASEDTQKFSAEMLSAENSSSQENDSMKNDRKHENEEITEKISKPTDKEETENSGPVDENGITKNDSPGKILSTDSNKTEVKLSTNRSKSLEIDQQQQKKVVDKALSIDGSKNITKIIDKSDASRPSFADFMKKTLDLNDVRSESTNVTPPKTENPEISTENENDKAKIRSRYESAMKIQSLYRGYRVRKNLKSSKSDVLENSVVDEIERANNKTINREHVGQRNNEQSTKITSTSSRNDDSGNTVISGNSQGNGIATQTNAEEGTQENVPAGVEVLTTETQKCNGVVDDASSDVEIETQTSICGAHITQKALSNKSRAESDRGMEQTKRNNSTLRNKNMEVEAATKIQAGFRGYKVRKQLKMKDNPKTEMTKKSLRRKSSGLLADIQPKKQKENIELQEKSAVKIQAGIRGFLVRRRVKKPRVSEESST